MDVVGCRIGILDLDGLASHHTEDMRMISTAILIQDDRVLGNVEGPVAESVLHVNEYVGQIAAAYDDALGFIRAFAAGVLAHVDLRGLGRGAVELYSSTDRRHRGRINRRRGCSWLSFFFGRSVGGLLGALIASCKRQQCAECQEAEED